jgi:hypothetical protein
VNVKKNEKLALVATVAVLLIAGLWYQFGGHRTAAGQLPLVELSSRSLDQLRNDFNAASGEPRIILLLSPT